jgi:hypothetical protein
VCTYRGIFKTPSSVFIPSILTSHQPKVQQQKSTSTNKRHSKHHSQAKHCSQYHNCGSVSLRLFLGPKSALRPSSELLSFRHGSIVSSALSLFFYKSNATHQVPLDQHTSQQCLLLLDLSFALLAPLSTSTHLPPASSVHLTLTRKLYSPLTILELLFHGFETKQEQATRTW